MVRTVSACRLNSFYYNSSYRHMYFRTTIVAYVVHGLIESIYRFYRCTMVINMLPRLLQKEKVLGLPATKTGI